MYATSYEDDSSDEENASAGVQAAWVLQTRSRRQHSVETARVSFESCIVSSGASSRCRLTKGRGAFRGEMRVEDILIDIDDDFLGPEVLPKFGTRRRSLRPRFPPHQAEANACTRVVDRGI